MMNSPTGESGVDEEAVRLLLAMTLDRVRLLKAGDQNTPEPFHPVPAGVEAVDGGNHRWHLGQVEDEDTVRQPGQMRLAARLGQHVLAP